MLATIERENHVRQFLTTPLMPFSPISGNFFLFEYHSMRLSLNSEELVFRRSASSGPYGSLTHILRPPTTALSWAMHHLRQSYIFSIGVGLPLAMRSLGQLA